MRRGMWLLPLTLSVAALVAFAASFFGFDQPRMAQALAFASPAESEFEPAPQPGLVDSGNQIHIAVLFTEGRQGSISVLSPKRQRVLTRSERGAVYNGVVRIEEAEPCIGSKPSSATAGGQVVVPGKNRSD